VLCQLDANVPVLAELNAWVPGFSGAPSSASASNLES